MKRRSLVAVMVASSLVMACWFIATALGGQAAPKPAAKIDMLGVQAANISTWNQVLTALTRNYARTAPGSTFKYIYAPQAQINQRIQLLSGQNALPLLYNTPALDTLGQMNRAGQVVNVEREFKRLGVYNELVPAAVSILKKVNGGRVLSLPFEFNIEGVWYNKKLFAAHGVAVPKTWAQLVAAAAKLQAAGVQPFAASGIQGWPITRLLGNYLFSTVGADAMTRVKAGRAKLTDAQYVAAAQQIADLGSKGYFGQGVTSLDYTPAEDLFLTGKAAMFYMGSWILAELNDPKRNTIGLANVGFFSFPTVPGGKGPAKIVPMNAGQTTSISPSKLNAANREWLRYFARNYGDVAMRLKGQISGFKVHNPPRNLSSATKLVVANLATAKNPVLWFEALFSAKATTVSQQNAAPLVTGQMSAREFMDSVQKAISG